MRAYPHRMNDLSCPNDSSCHGVVGCLHASSRRWPWNPLAKPWQKLRSFVVWHVENRGVRKGLSAAGLGLWQAARGPHHATARGCQTTDPGLLALQPGELVEVKPVAEILATLDPNRRHQGLLWMTGMQKYCGRQYRVYKQVQRITLESNGEQRTMRNTVLLEGVLCDGRDFGGCDRSCFHFWREAWLRRVNSGIPEERRDGMMGA